MDKLLDFIICLRSAIVFSEYIFLLLKSGQYRPGPSGKIIKTFVLDFDHENGNRSFYHVRVA
jgi:hypothetical protein